MIREEVKKKMSEKEPKSIFFSFICPEERVEETRKLFREESLGQLSDVEVRGERKLINLKTGNVITCEGIQLVGVAFSGDSERIYRALAERGIAGYSRATQVIFGGGEEIEFPPDTF